MRHATTPSNMDCLESIRGDARPNGAHIMILRQQGLRRVLGTVSSRTLLIALTALATIVTCPDSSRSLEPQLFV